MTDKKDAVLMGPFVGELYWECGRFAPLLPYMRKKQFVGRDITYIILTREDRFDLYGKFADILVPLRVNGDYDLKSPNCFKLNGLKPEKYQEIVKDFNKKYKERFNIIKHIYPSIKKPDFLNKNQFPRKDMLFSYRPRKENYEIVENYLPKDKPLVVLAPRYRKGFKRNWDKWPEFYNLLWNDKKLLEDFNFIVCGKKGEYIPDEQNRFLDLNNMTVGTHSSLVGLLLVVLENSFFTFGSQSAIPNMSLLFKVDVLEFGCQKKLHTKTYNINGSPITFIENRRYDINPKVIFKTLKNLLYEKKEKIKQ